MSFADAPSRDRLGFLMVTLTRQWRRFVEEQLAASGLTDATWTPLLHLRAWGDGVTQKELADRCELSKGFISQLESNQTSPSLSTLEDILTTLGSSFHEFFSDEQGDDPVCRKEDVFVKEDDGVTIHWLIPNAQKKDIEPILVTIQPGAETETDLPHMGEEFGYVLSGAVTLELGGKSYRVRKGDSFSFKPSQQHHLKNTGKTPATVIWVCTPPNF